MLTPTARWSAALTNGGECSLWALRMVALLVGLALNACGGGSVAEPRASELERPSANLVRPLSGGADRLNGEPIALLEGIVSWPRTDSGTPVRIQIGSEPTTFDVADSGTLQPGTSEWRPTSDLPRNRPLFVRLLRLLGGQWQSVASARFEIAADPGSLTRPAAGVVLDPVGVSQGYAWAAVPTADAYYLWTGRSPGAKDILDTGELHHTVLTYPMTPTPPADTNLYARLHYRINGVWQYRDDVMFRVVPANQLVRPTANELIVQSEGPLQWQVVPGTEAHYLWIGSQPGIKDVVDSGELASTVDSLSPVALLPRGRTLYARLYRLIQNRWTFDVDVPFAVAERAGDIRFPHTGQTLDEIDLTSPVSWSPDPDAAAYYLYVGTAPGTADVVDTGSLSPGTSSWRLSRTAPLGVPLYARLYVLKNGAWGHNGDVEFRFQPRTAVLLAPANRALILGTVADFSWAGTPAAQGYRVTIGADLGHLDYDDSGPLSPETLAYRSRSPLPTGVALYVRLWTLADGQWQYFRDQVISIAGAIPVPAISYPLHGAHFDSSRPMAWGEIVSASAYRLRIGTTPAGSELHDSGPIATHLRFVSGLPTGQQLYGTISARINGTWVDGRFEFQAGVTAPSEQAMLDAVRTASARVRAMANRADQIFPGTMLEPLGIDGRAYCANFAYGLLVWLSQASLPLPVRVRDTCMVRGGTDCHTLVEVHSQSGQTWQSFDPTFGASLVNPATNSRMSVDEIADAVRTFNHADLRFDVYDKLASTRLDTYYLDYRLLFANPAPVPGSGPSPEQSVRHHFNQLGSAASGYGPYALQCSDGMGSATALVDGNLRTWACNGPDRLTSVFVAGQIELDVDAAGAAGLLQPIRPPMHRLR